MIPDHTCPHCGQRMLMRHGVRLSPKLADIFDLIEASRPRSITREVLADVLFPGRNRRKAMKCVSVHINHLNDFLEPTDFRVRMNGEARAYRVQRESVIDRAGRKSIPRAVAQS